MALKKALTAEETARGVAAPDAVHHIDQAIFDGRGGVTFNVASYANSAVYALVPLTGPFLTRTYVMFPYDHGVQMSPLNQLYGYLKTLPEFAGAIDV